MRKSVKIIITALCFSLIWMTIVPISMAEDQGSESGADTGNKVDESTSRFSDMEGQWSEAAVERLAEAGILNGYPDGTFKPQQNVTRAEVAKIICTAFDLKEQETPDYPDVDPDKWYYSYIVRAYPYMSWYGPYESGSPYARPFQLSSSEGCFLPEEADLRMFLAETLSVLKAERDGKDIEFPDFETIHEDLTGAFIDGHFAEWIVGPHGGIPVNFSRMLEYCWSSWKMGIFEGDENHWFGPIQPVTRAALAVTIDRVLNTDDSGDEK